MTESHLDASRIPRMVLPPGPMICPSLSEGTRTSSMRGACGARARRGGGEHLAISLNTTRLASRAADRAAEMMAGVIPSTLTSI